MNHRLTLALGAAALAAILAQPASAGHVGLNIGIGIQPPWPAVVVAPPPPPPPPVAYTYHYYPRQQVYFDPARGLYFWYERGSWLWGPSLPGYIVLGPRYLPLHLHGPWPYQHHHQVYRRHPPHVAHPGPWQR
jgi:hypothetical protein